VESPLRRKAHGGFGERPGETDRQQCPHRAPGRLSLTAFADHGADGAGEPLAIVLRPGNAGSVRHEVAQVEWIHREEVG
jgi:hypothetical protein